MPRLRTEPRRVYVLRARERAVANLYTPTFTVKITREFDGKIEGVKSWTLRGAGDDVDRFEDALTFICNAAFKTIPTPPPELRSVGKTGSESK